MFALKIQVLPMLNSTETPNPSSPVPSPPIWAVLLLFLAQCYLVVRGCHHFQKWWNPVLLLATTVGICWLYARFLLKTKQLELSGEAAGQRFFPKKMGWLGLLLGLVSVATAYEEIRKLFVQYKINSWSDVQIQLQAQYDRWAAGEMPYQPVPCDTYEAYPVYMPLHWLPIGLGRLTGLDFRWSGVLFLGLAAGLAGWLVFRQHGRSWRTVVAVLLPSVGLWAFVLWGGLDLAITFEVVIAAYYLVLAAGLASGRNSWVLAGLIFCLLSRYTLVFWLPLLALIFFEKYPLRWQISFWSTVAAAVFVVYIWPFLLKDPTILAKGIEYHNNAATDEWRGFGDPPVSPTMLGGYSFALHMKSIFTGGDWPERVFHARVVQGSLMLLLLGFGWLGWRRWRPDGHQWALLVLFAMVAAFYYFGPLTYKYYWLPPLMLAAVICGKMICPRRVT